MSAENFTNYALTALNGAITTTTTGTFAVTGGQGALFPTTNFVVSIDSELIFISSRSSDTFTMATRGFNSTTAATHSNGVSVVLPVCAYTMQHLWQNVADTFIPAVPPVQVGNSPSSYDNEFESAGSWTLYPTPGGSTVFNAGSNLKSHLLLSRASPDTAVYTAYVAFAPGAITWTATCKLSEGSSLLNANGDFAETSFFVTDQSNPTASADSGNRFKLNTALGDLTQFSHVTSNVLTPDSHIVRTIVDVSGSASYASSSIPLQAGAPVWLRMTCNGSGTYQSFMSSDGVTFWQLGTSSGLGFTIASLGLSFANYNPSGRFVAHTVAVDYVRIVTNAAEPPYGS